MLSGCATSNEPPEIPVATVQNELLSAPLAGPTPSPLSPVVSPTATTAVTPTFDSGSLSLLVFDEKEETVGRLSVDGMQFQPLYQVPKLDSTGLELGLFSEHSSYFVSPDGRWVSKIVGYDQLILANTETDRRSTIARIGGGAWLSWSPDSQSFVYREGNSRVCVYELAEQTPDCLDDLDGKVVAAAWAPDSSALALSVAVESEQSTPGVVPGEVWLIQVATQQAQFITDQHLPLEIVSVDELLVWTERGLIVNRLAGGAPAALIDEGIESFLTANAASASPDGRYVIYEDGRVERIGGRTVVTEVPVCADTQSQVMTVAWAPDEQGFAATVHCRTDGSTQLVIVRFADNNSISTRPISSDLRLMGWSHDDNYLFFREPGASQAEGYKIQRLGIEPDSTFETVASSTYLIAILPTVDGRK